MKDVELPEVITPEWVSREHVRLLNESGKGNLRLDCRRLRKLDSLTLAWLTRIQSYMEGTGRKLILANLPADLQSDLSQARIPEEAEPPAREKTSVTMRVGDWALRFAGEARNTALLLSESLFWSTA